MVDFTFPELILILSFALICLLVVAIRAIDNIAVNSKYSDEIKAVKSFYNFLDYFPYEKTDVYQPILSDEFYNEANEKTFSILVKLDYKIQENKKLKDKLNFLLNKVYYADQSCGEDETFKSVVLLPIFNSQNEFNQSKKEIRQAIDYVLKCLKTNQVN
jgi:hypothetical protein